MELPLRVWLGGHPLSPGLGGAAMKAASGLGVGGGGAWVSVSAVLL